MLNIIANIADHIARALRIARCQRRYKRRRYRISRDVPTPSRKKIFDAVSARKKEMAMMDLCKLKGCIVRSMPMHKSFVFNIPKTEQRDGRLLISGLVACTTAENKNERYAYFAQLRSNGSVHSLVMLTPLELDLQRGPL